MRAFWFLILFLAGVSISMASTKDSLQILLSDVKIQIEATQAVNDMYNFKFDHAEMQFRWIKQKYPEHPLPYFLLGMSHWWKMMPNLADQSWDEDFLNTMDLAISKAEVLYDDENCRVEAAFFLAACHGQKGRLYSERGNWGKAANAGEVGIEISRRKPGET